MSGMKVTFRVLWLLWVVGPLYDIVISKMGYFQQRTLAMRIADDLCIAWFIFSAWIVVLCIREETT